MASRGPRFRKARWVALDAAFVLSLAALVSPWWYVGIDRPTWSMTVGNGRARVWWLEGGRTFPDGRRPVTLDIRAYRERPTLWFGWNTGPGVPTAWVPLWAAVLPVWGVAGLVCWLGPPMPRRGRCHGCGYSLRGLKAAGEIVRCPECGEQRRIRMVEARILASYDDPPEDHPPEDPGRGRQRAD